MGSSTHKSHGPVPDLELFQKEFSVFSHLVRNRMSRLGLDYISHTVPDGQPLKHELLVRAGGKDQIPFLVDHATGVKLYGIRAISAYLDKSYGSPVPTSTLDKVINQVSSRVATVMSRAQSVAQKIRTRAQGARA